MSASSKAPTPSRRDEFDLVGRLSEVVSGPAPRVLLVKGPAGSGKSSLLRAIVARLPGPFLYVAYRISTPRTTDGRPAGEPEISLMLLDTVPAGKDDSSADSYPSVVPISFAPSGAPSSAGLPEPLSVALQRLAAAGTGCVVVDAWDRSTEEAFRAASVDRTTATVIRSPLALLGEELGRIGVHTLAAVVGRPTAQIESAADGVVELGAEPLDGAELRVLRVAHLDGAPIVDSRFLFTLSGGRFSAPVANGAGFVGPPGPPDPEPSGELGSIWPGSTGYVQAFGRLRHHGLTAFELTEQTPLAVPEAIVVPMVVSVVRGGGRVVWVPGGTSSPARIGRLLTPFLPPEAIGQGVRVLSASPHDPPTGALAPIALRVRRPPTPGAREEERRVADPVAPFFPEAFRFLRDRPADGPALFVLTADGLAALSAVTGHAYDPATFPLIISTYARLAGFHGVGLGPSDHPLVKAMLPSVDVDLRLYQRYGRPVVLGVRPRTPAYLLDWPTPDGRYALVPVQ